MNSVMKKLIGIILLLGSFAVRSQTDTETITREFQFEKKDVSNALMIFNINGGVKIEGYAGDKVMVEVKKTIRAKTDARLAMGKEEIQLGVIDRADSIILYVKGTCQSFGQGPRRKNWNRRVNNWGYEWNSRGHRDDDCDRRYDYVLDFTIKVPTGIHVVASTINSGDIEVKSVKGNVIADNINGSIKLADTYGATYASTINGSLNLDYSGNPPGDSRFYSLNGDINANFRKGLAAQLAFKSFNGDLYSSLDDLSLLPVQLEKTDKGGKGTEYRVSGNRYKVRQGGPLLDFETFNGDVYLREK